MNKKYLLYLVLLGIFCTFNDTIIAKSSISKKDKSAEKSNSKCPHGDIPVQDLSSTELEEVLDCRQEQKDLNESEAPGKKPKKLLLNYITDAPRCPYSTTPLKKLKAAQLEEVYAYTESHKMDAAFMIDLLERLIALSDNHADVKKYKLQLADTHYAAHHIEKAAECYEDFGVLYPSSEESEYALYKAVACMFELALEPDRDQTNSKKTIGLIKEFLKRAKNQDLISEAKSILQQCYDRLYDHEVYVFNFYAKKKNFVAAQMRLDYIAKTFTETINNLDKKVNDLTAQLELRKNPIKPTRKSIVNKLLA